jgi:hypothetical protein
MGKHFNVAHAIEKQRYNYSCQAGSLKRDTRGHQEKKQHLAVDWRQTRLVSFSFFGCDEASQRWKGF